LPESQQSLGVAAALAPSDKVLIRAWTHNRPRETAIAYARDASQFLGWIRKPLAEVTLADLMAWDGTLAAKAPATRARKLAALRSLIRYAKDMGAVEGDPVRGLRAPKVPDHSPIERILTEDQVKRILDGERDPRRRCLLRLLYLCGLRASEAANARRGHVTARPKGGAELRVVGKGGKARTVAIPPVLWRELEALHGPATAGDAPLIPNRSGQPLDRFAVHRCVKRAVKRAGLPDASSHWFRHSSASHALDRGAPPQVVQQSLGHASLATTTKYAHARPGDRAGDYLPE
jgi:site-specific recombinase XerD